jgi:hypothetical protein
MRSPVRISASSDSIACVNVPTRALVYFPGGSTHWFRFGSGGGEMISMTSRPGAAAFFSDVDREVSPTEPDIDVLLRVASSHGLTVVLPAS